MIPGSVRYMRGLGYVGGPTVAESERGFWEKVLGVDATGTPTKIIGGSGTGMVVGAAPSTLLAAVLGASIGTALSSKHRIFGGIGGAFLGAGIATGLRFAKEAGI